MPDRTSSTATPADALDGPPSRPMTWLDPSAPRRQPQTGHAVLDQVATFVRRFSAFPSDHCAPTLALWYAHTHLADRLYVTPRLILDSAEPGSGKTRVLEVAQYLVAAPEMTVSASRAALFRLVAEGPITILFDEVDTIFTKAGGGNEDLRAMLNAGYKRSATIPRYDGKTRNVRRFPVYTPAALAGIAGGMPDTITTRAITIHMRRRRADEQVEPFRERSVEEQAQPIRAALSEWLGFVAEDVADAQPVMPDGVTDRPAEIWEPLIAIADAAGGHWPTTARKACAHFVLTRIPSADSFGIQLLSDLRDIFTAAETDRMASREILAHLLTLDDSPWADLPDKPLDARRLSRELTRYGIKPVTFDAKAGKAKGYVTFATSGKQEQAGLADAWTRYLPAIDNTETTSNTAGQTVTDDHRVGSETLVMDHRITRRAVTP
ncbi:MAG TPA: DUF3631 domain-containing protein [Pseudonocardiaceae bacterium]|nr:DUF3631 domain-containing protein [Pseudonocardiaceae bacterium]